MREYLPLLIVGAIIGAFTIAFIVAYLAMKNKKEAVGFDRNMEDGELVKRLIVYAKPYWKDFLAVLLIMTPTVFFAIQRVFDWGDKVVARLRQKPEKRKKKKTQ